MNGKLLMAAGLAVGLAVGGILAVGGVRSEAEGSSAAAQAKAEPTKPLGPPDRAKAPLPEGANATEVYNKLSQDLQALTQQATTSTSPEDAAKLFSQAESKLIAFRSQYPGTPEALDAAFQLGALDYSVGKYDDATRYLTEFAAKAGESDHEKLAYAHFYLAETYRSQGKYDSAEGEYKLILSKYQGVNPRLNQYVQTNLDGLALERKIAVGGEPIDFSVKSIKGETLSPAAFRGKVLLIDFWATWCGPCVAEMPNVKSVYKKYHAKGFEIVGISLDQSRDKLDTYLQQYQIEWPQYFDGKWWNNDVAVKYGIKSIPTTVLVDRKGKIRYKSLRGKQLETAVEQLLNEKV